MWQTSIWVGLNRPLSVGGVVVEGSQLKVAWNKAGKVYVEVSLLGSGRWRDHPSCGLQTRPVVSWEPPDSVLPSSSPLGFSNFDIFLKTLFFFYHKLAQIHSNFTILGVLGPPLHGGHKISQKTCVQILMHPTVVGAFSEYWDCWLTLMSK